MASPDPVQIDIDGPIATVTINRPEALNALNDAVMAGLSAAFDQIGSSPARAVILTGAGDKAFVAGADIKEFQGLDRPAALAYAQRGQALMLKIEQFGAPVIAAVNGYALGGGCELALACHLRIASQNAVFGQPEVGLGVIAGFGGSQRLPRLIGQGRALDLLITGRKIDAGEALSWGLVNQVTTPVELLATCRKIAARIARQAPIAVCNTLEVVNRGLDMTLQEGLDLEAERFASTFETADMREGVSAFIEKRDPAFKGQ